jgi:hypothetical protein
VLLPSFGPFVAFFGAVMVFRTLRNGNLPPIFVIWARFEPAFESV